MTTKIRSVAGPVRPVGDAATGAPRERIDDVEPSQQLAGGAPVPQQLAGSGIECHDVAIDAAVVHIAPLTISGLNLRARGAGRGRSSAPTSARPARRSRTLAAVIWFADESRVAPASPPKNRHSVSLLGALAPVCPAGSRPSLMPLRARRRPEALSLHARTFGLPYRGQFYSKFRRSYRGVDRGRRACGQPLERNHAVKFISS